MRHAYIDRTGNVVIDAGRYESGGNFSGGLAAVRDPRRGFGFIDKTGAFVIPPQFESTLGFSEGLAAVVLNDKWGFIDKSGLLVIQPQFDWVAEFSEGLAVVQRSSRPSRPKPPAGSISVGQSFITEVWDLTDSSPEPEEPDGEFLLIDTAGAVVAVPDQSKVHVHIDYARFSEGLLCAYSPEQKAMGYINKACEFVIQPGFVAAAPFSEGLARVAVLEEDDQKLAFIDKHGDFVIRPQFNTDFDFLRNSSDFSEGLAAVSEGLNPSRMEDSTFVYIDKTGEIVLATEFFYAAEFREGLAAVYNDTTNRYGFIDKTGRVVIPLQYEVANDFSEGLACVVC